MNRSSFSEGPLLKLSWEVSVGGENSFNSFVSMSVLQHIYIIHCLKGSCLYQ